MQEHALEARALFAFADDHELLRIVIAQRADFLEDVTLRRLSLGDAAVDVALHRRGSDLSIEVLGRRGRLGVDLS